MGNIYDYHIRTHSFSSDNWPIKDIERDLKGPVSFSFEFIISLTYNYFDIRMVPLTHLRLGDCSRKQTRWSYLQSGC